MSIQTTLGARLVRLYNEYSAATGTLTCAVASGNATQGTAGNRPTSAESPGGIIYPVFDGVDDRLLAPAMSALPAYDAGHHQLMAGLFTCVEIQASGSFLYGPDTDFYYVADNGRLTICNAQSTAAVNDGELHAFVAARNGTTDTVTLWLDGVAQATTSATDMGQDWRTTTEAWIGDRPGGGFAWEGAMPVLLWAYDVATPFSNATIAQLFVDLAQAYDGVAAPVGYNRVSLALGVGL